jgi:TonB family protein
MLDLDRRTKLSLLGHTLSGSAAALLLAFALVIFTGRDVRASLPSAEQDQKQSAGLSAPAQGQVGQSGGNIERMSKDLKPTILYKEKAQYTEEARRNRLEGTVILDVVFASDGSMKDIQVFSGLPDGLTGNAIEATKQIKFEAATREGKPVNVRGKLEFQFKLYDSPDGPKKEEQDKTETIHAMSASLRPTITYKVQADYTFEARQNKVEGDVLLSVLFGADGKIGAIRVERGLPYGLTERAIVAARAIRFEPAMKDGKPVSVRGNLEFHFNL